MTTQPAVESDVAAGPAPFSRIPLASRALVLVVVALALLAALAGRWNLSGQDWARFGLILTLGISCSALTRRVERIRRALGAGLVPDLQGAWVVVAAVALPPVLIGATAVAIFAAELPVRRTEQQSRSERRQPSYKIVYTVAAVALPAIVGHFAADWSGGSIRGAAIVAATVVVGNNGLILAAIASSGQRQKFSLFTGSALRQFVDVVSTGVGAVMGSVLLAAGSQPSILDAIVVFGIPALMAMQSISVQVEASQPDVLDPITGLLCSDRLTEVAQLELISYQHSTVILIQILGEKPADVRAAAGVLRANLERGSDLPPALLGRSDAATFAILLAGDRPEFGAQRRSAVHDRLAAAGVPHIVAMGYPAHAAEQFHDVVMRVGGLLVEAVPGHRAVGREG